MKWKGIFAVVAILGALTSVAGAKPPEQAQGNKANQAAAGAVRQGIMGVGHGIGAQVSAWAHQGIHGTELAARIHQLHAMRGKAGGPPGQLKAQGKGPDAGPGRGNPHGKGVGPAAKGRPDADEGPGRGKGKADDKDANRKDDEKGKPAKPDHPAGAIGGKLRGARSNE